MESHKADVGKERVVEEQKQALKGSSNG